MNDWTRGTSWVGRVVMNSVASFKNTWTRSLGAFGVHLAALGLRLSGSHRAPRAGTMPR